MDVIDFQPEHLAALKGRLQPMQAAHDVQCTEEYGRMLLEAGPVWTGIEGDLVLGVAGIVRLWTGRAHLWAYLSEDAGPRMLAISRAVNRQLDALGYPRYEAEVSPDFPAARRWVEMLGFKCETPDGMEAFFPDGSRGLLHSKVKV